jgi:hypothetical protein
MHLRFSLRFLSLGILAAAVACGASENTGPSTEPPAKVEAASDLQRTAVVGTAVPGGNVVKVTDASGRPVLGATVAFAVTAGNGSANPRLALTDAKGQASATWTLGTIVGPNEVTASVDGVTSSVRFQATGSAGAVTAISLSTQNARILATSDTLRITAQALDSFGNVASPAPSFIARDPTLVSVDATGLIRALRRGSATYVVASSSGKTDSVLVTVLAVGQSICTAAAIPMELAVGQVVTDLSGSGICVHASSANAEYALVPFYNSNINSATIQIEARPQGVVPLSLPSAAAMIRAPSQLGLPSLVKNEDFEIGLRERERVEGAKLLSGARQWMGARRNFVGGRALSVTVPAVGDIMPLNVNPFDFCTNPDTRTGRVVAVTDKAIVVADTANPPLGGFTSEEYRSIGVTFDSLVDPIDRANFGAPTDIDANGHVILFFTRAVNELTAQGSSSVYLGYFYQRDLYPKTSQFGTCASSNVAEVFYLLVPDTAGVVNGTKRSKTQVISFTNGTVAHEYEHLINASRRMYVNGVGANFEDKWLDEGLAHVAEELNYYASSKLSPRSNIDGSVVPSAAFQTFMNNNARRYFSYIASDETQSPVGFDPSDDDLQTRGAIWSFLRYAADHQKTGTTESSVWFNLVNSKTSGIANLTSVLGQAPNSLLRDWAISEFIDDNTAGTLDPRFQQPSWNMRSVATASGAPTFQLRTRTLVNNGVSQLILANFGVSFMRFSVASGDDALITVTSQGQPLPPTVQLAVVRVR